MSSMKFAYFKVCGEGGSVAARYVIGVLGRRWYAYQMRDMGGRIANLTRAAQRSARFDRYSYNESIPLPEVWETPPANTLLEEAIPDLVNSFQHISIYGPEGPYVAKDIKEFTWAEFRREAFGGQDGPVLTYHDQMPAIVLSIVNALLTSGWSARHSPQVRQRVDHIHQYLLYWHRYASIEVAQGSATNGFFTKQVGALWRDRHYVTGGYAYNETQFKEDKKRFRTLGEKTRAFINALEAGDGDEVDNTREAFLSYYRSYHHHLRFNPEKRQRLVDAVNSHSLLSEVESCDCGHIEEMEQTHTVRSGGSFAMWCDACYDSRAVFVDDVDEYWDRDEAYYHSDGLYYSYAEDSDDDEEDDGGDADRRRAMRARGEIVMDYGVRVTGLLDGDRHLRLNTNPFSDFCMGVELEMTSGRNGKYDAAKDVRTRLGEDYCIVKNDGSLPENGFEVVTAPYGLDEHIKRFMAWEVNPAYRAWDTHRCGLHVHIHSRAFSELTLGKFLVFMNKDSNAAFIYQIAGRHPLRDDQARQYCAAEQQHILINPKQAVKHKSYERYRIVNLQNLTRREAERLGVSDVDGKYDTVEVRIFRASLKKERLLAQIEFVHALVMFCRVASLRELNGGAFLKWLRKTTRYPHLANWFGTRKSKIVKDAGNKPLADVCEDKVAAGGFTTPKQTHEQIVQGYALIERPMHHAIRPEPEKFPDADMAAKKRFVANTYGYSTTSRDCEQIALTLLRQEWKTQELERIAKEVAARREKEERELAEREARRERDREALEALARDRKQREQEERARRKQEQAEKAAQAKRARREARKYEDQPRDQFGRFVARDEAQRRSLRQRSARANAQPSGLLAGLVARVEPPPQRHPWSSYDIEALRHDVFNGGWDDWSQQVMYQPNTTNPYGPQAWSTATFSGSYAYRPHLTVYDEVQLTSIVDEAALRTALDRVMVETGMQANELIRPATEEEIRAARERMRAIGINNPEWDS